MFYIELLALLVLLVPLESLYMSLISSPGFEKKLLSNA